MRVLLPIDLKQPSEAIVAAAELWVARLGGVVDMVYVSELEIPLPHVSDAAVQSVLSEHWNRVRSEHEAALQALMNTLPVPQRGAVRLASGPPANAVVELAVDYDLLLVGTHGRTGLAQLWLGSVAERIVRLSPKPVLVLRQSE
jgi:nucleotide-binding universal stress UspA family protein